MALTPSEQADVMTSTRVQANGLYFTFSKKGNIATISFNGTATAAVSSAVKICDIPSGYEPDYNFTDYGNFTCVIRDTTGGSIFLVDLTATEVKANSGISVGSKLRGSTSYIVK